MSVARLRAALVVCLIVAIFPGCLTQRAHERWSGRDRVSAIRFRVEELAKLRWAVQGGRRERAGSFDLRDALGTCTSPRYLVYTDDGVQMLRPGEWLAATLEPGALAPVRLDRDAEPCDLGVFLEYVGRDRDPRVALRLGGQPLASKKIAPPRRIGMGFAYPFAALADTVIVATIVGSGAFLFFLFADSPAWYTWTKSHGIERNDIPPEDEFE